MFFAICLLISFHSFNCGESYAFLPKKLIAAIYVFASLLRSNYLPNKKIEKNSLWWCH